MYLDAWTHVKSLLAKSKDTSPATPALLELSDNWTNAEFVQFVDDLAELVDKWVTLSDSVAGLTDTPVLQT